jgi:hypothetical protein
MTDQRLSHSETAELSEARAAISAHAREAFAHDLERQRKQAELTAELSRASAEMQTQVEHREHLMNAIIDAQSAGSAKPASSDPTTLDGITRAPPPGVEP